MFVYFYMPVLNGVLKKTKKKNSDVRADLSQCYRNKWFAFLKDDNASGYKMGNYNSLS